MTSSLAAATDSEGESQSGFGEHFVHPHALSKAKVMGVCMLSDKGRCFIEGRTIYGAVIVMPQLARSMDWTGRLVFEAIRAWVLYGLDLVLQFLLIMMLSRHENVSNTFSGQMFLCDLGAGCVDNSGHEGGRCTGPAGTEITPARTYTFDVWNTRMFVKQSMQAIFPDQHDAIEKLIDPGEYGVESHWCRWICIFLFMMAMIQEIENILDMFYLLRYVPSKDESWVHVEEHHHHDSDEEKTPSSSGDKEVEAWPDEVKISIAGMPLSWKIITGIFVLFPKMLVWKMTVETGVTFLMETDSIDDLITNSVALTFILAISELICESLTSDLTLDMLNRCQDYALYSKKRVNGMSDREIVDEFGSDEAMRTIKPLELIMAIIPVKVLCVLVLTACFVLSYYKNHCIYDGGLTWFPNPLRLAATSHYSVLTALFPNLFPVEWTGDELWHMPPQV